MTSTAALLMLLAFPARAASVEDELSPIVDSLYDLQLDTAAAGIKTFAAAHPGHPAAAFYASLADYQRWAFASSEDTSALKGFEDGLAATGRLAELWIATSPAEGYYYIGAARGFSSRVLADRGKMLRATAPGLRSIRYLRRALALDPSLVDANLGIGMYDYFRSQLPAAAKPFAFLFTFESGSRERGLKELTLVADKGRLARPEAQSVLGAIYSSESEREFGRASVVLSWLCARYPHNPAFRMRLGYSELRLHHWDQAMEVDDPDGSWLSALDPRFRDQARALALYRAAEAALFAGKYAKADAWVDALAKLPAAQPLDDWTALRRANLDDAQGMREQALEIYAKIDDPTVRPLADAFKINPFPDGPKDVKPWTGFELPR